LKPTRTPWVIPPTATPGSRPPRRDMFRPPQGRPAHPDRDEIHPAPDPDALAHLDPHPDALSRPPRPVRLGPRIRRRGRNSAPPRPFASAGK
jgi:hypothetical protein